MPQDEENTDISLFLKFSLSDSSIVCTLLEYFPDIELTLLSKMASSLEESRRSHRS
jgi:hypothetical protein